MLDFTVMQVTELTVKRAILWHLIGLSWFKIHLRRPLLTSSVKDIFKLTVYENHSGVTFEHEGAISSSPKPNLKVNFTLYIYSIHATWTTSNARPYPANHRRADLCKLQQKSCHCILQVCWLYQEGCICPVTHLQWLWMLKRYWWYHALFYLYYTMWLVSFADYAVCCSQYESWFINHDNY